MRIAITGAAGFIGTALRRYLHAQGHEVHALSRSPLNDPSSVCHTVDLLCQEINSLMKHLQPDVLIHAAGQSSVPDSVVDPGTDFRSGPPVVFQLLDALRCHCPDSVFIFLSSAALYGNPTRLPIREADAVNPISPYGYHKYQAELIVEEFAKLFKMKTASLRVFSAYGSGMKKQLLWDVCRKAVSSAEIPLLGTGREARDFIHIDDICQSIELVWQDKDLFGQPINICSGDLTSIADIASMIASHFPHKPAIRFTGAAHPGAPTCWQGDSSWLRKRGFAASVSLDDGVREYVEWFRGNHSAEVL